MTISYKLFFGKRGDIIMPFFVTIENVQRKVKNMKIYFFNQLSDYNYQRFRYYQRIKQNFWSLTSYYDKIQVSIINGVAALLLQTGDIFYGPPGMLDLWT